MFNADQASYSQYLASVPPEKKCWCGWEAAGKCLQCPPHLTAADKRKVWCHHCKSDPGWRGGVLRHAIGCPMRREAPLPRE